jgi:hypothetical protein
VTKRGKKLMVKKSRKVASNAIQPALEEQSLNSKQVHVEDFSHKAFRRAYVKALFLENRRWITAIEKYQMIVSGSPKNTKDKARDLADREYLQDQVTPSVKKWLLEHQINQIPEKQGSVI